MNAAPRQKDSAYMEWAKLQSHARFNLATSGIISVPAAEFPSGGDRMEITVPGAYGYGPLQEQIAQHAGVSPDCVVAAAGTSMANHLAMAAVLNPGDEVLIEHPTYGLLTDLANYLGVRVSRFHRRLENNFDVDLDEIASRLTPQTRLLVLTNLHNPSGALLPAETLRAIGQLAQKAGAEVLVDEVYLEMLLIGASPSAFQIGQELDSLGPNPFIVTNSLTKAYGLSGLRCGWILARPELAHRIWRLNDLFGVNAAHPAEQLSVLAFQHLERFRKRAHALLTANRPLLDAFLNSRTDLKWLRPPAGTVVFPRLTSNRVEIFLKRLREKYETSVVPGAFFELPQHFRIGIGGQTAELDEGLQRLGAALDELTE